MDTLKIGGELLAPSTKGQEKQLMRVKANILNMDGTDKGKHYETAQRMHAQACDKIDRAGKQRNERRAKRNRG
jgi:hypothetical protein